MSAGRTYGGRTAEERAAARRAAFLEAGLQLYGTRPSDDITVGEIVDAAGQTRRAFYELFADREDLLRQVDERIRDGVVAAVVAAVGEDRGWEATERALRAVFRFYAEDPRRVNVAFVAVVGVSAALEHHRRRAFRLLGETFGELLGERAGPDPRSRRLAAQAFAGAFSELLTDHTWAGDDELDAVERELVTLLRARFGGADG